MKRLALALLAGMVALGAQPAVAQSEEERVVTTIHAAPGRYMDVVQWMVDVDRIRAEAGLAPRLIYRHHNGANWDFLVIEAPLVADEEALMEAAGERLGIDIPRGRFREIVMDHEDTVVGGPHSGAQIMAEMTE